MHLTLYSDYSLRVMIYLAASPEGKLSSVSQIAEAYQISRNHLVKVVHNLSKLGYVRTYRGINGGMELAIEPQNINIGDVIRRIEPHFEVVECFNHKTNTCPIDSVCELKTIFNESLQAFFSVLDKYTLSDIIKNRSSLSSILSLIEI